MESINPCACDVEKVMKDISTMDLGSFDYCRNSGAVKQELTEILAGWSAKVEDQLCDGWDSSTILNGEIHQFFSGEYKGLTT